MFDYHTGSLHNHSARSMLTLQEYGKGPDGSVVQPSPLAQAHASQLSPSPPPFMHNSCGGGGGGVGGTWVLMQFKGCSKRQARSQKAAEHSSSTPAALSTHTDSSLSTVSVAAVAGQAWRVRPRALRIQGQSLLRREVLWQCGSSPFSTARASAQQRVRLPHTR